MNKYVIPVVDYTATDIWNEVISARSLEDCQNKLMDRLCDMYDFLDTGQDYSDFIEQCDKSDILIGEITDIEEL